METFTRLLRYFGNFYKGTFIVWLIWVVFLDNNNLRTVWANYNKRVSLEADTLYYSRKIKEVKKERDEVFGDRRMVEKWAREKYRLRKPGEEVFLIVDENNRPLEKDDK